MTSPDPERRRMDKRYFTVTEVNAMLPELQRTLFRIMQLKGQVRGAYAQLDASGAAPDEEDVDVVVAGLPSGVIQQRARLKGLVETLRDELQTVHRMGCIIKDIELGLVDWLAQHQGREILLCWRVGESEVGYWHDLSDGFRGRRPVSEL